jgi:hypothetical protein
MAIDRGPWNALVDDDGSNLVGSIWNKAAIKTVILDPTDAAFSALPPSVVPTYGSFTPSDASGAGLVFGGGTVGTYAKVGRIVLAWMTVFYPATSSPANASIDGLPFAATGGSMGGYQIYGPIKLWSINGTKIAVNNTTTGAQLTNTQMSGTISNVNLIYLTT